MDNTDKAFNRIKQDLDKVSDELVYLIDTYDLQVESPLEIIENAKTKITNPDDYIKFLELSLQGRLLGEAADYILHTQKNKPVIH